MFLTGSPGISLLLGGSVMNTHSVGGDIKWYPIQRLWNCLFFHIYALFYPLTVHLAYTKTKMSLSCLLPLLCWSVVCDCVRHIWLICRSENMYRALSLCEELWQVVGRVCAPEVHAVLLECKSQCLKSEMMVQECFTADAVSQDNHTDP